MDPKEIEWEDVDWINLPEDKNRWCPYVNVVMNRFHKMWEFFFFWTS